MTLHDFASADADTTFVVMADSVSITRVRLVRGWQAFVDLVAPWRDPAPVASPERVRAETDRFLRDRVWADGEDALPVAAEFAVGSRFVVAIALRRPDLTFDVAFSANERLNRIGAA